MYKRQINTLEGGLQLKAGDRVSITATQINQRGANVETVNFEKDIDEEIICCYYIMDTDVSFAGDKDSITTLYRDGLARPSGFETSKVGHLNTPYVFFGRDHEDLRPKQGSQKIAIPAGSYSPDNLSTIISEIFAGKYTEGKIPFDYVNDDNLRQNVASLGLPATNTEFMILISPNDETPSDVNADCPMFLQMKQAKEFIDDIIDDGGAVDKTEMIGKGKHWITTQSYDDTSDVGHNPLNQYQFLGAVPTIQWDADSSRFTLNNLHTPYRIPNYKTPTDDKAEENRGEEATEIYRNPIPFGKYPKNAFGGVMITNPAWSYVCLLYTSPSPRD